MDQRNPRRNRRAKVSRSMKLMSRDIAIIHTVYQYRVLRQNQLERLFGRSRSVMQRVLLRLYQHQFLDRRFLPVYAGSSPTLYVLDKRGAEVLRTQLGLDDLTWYSSSKDLKPDFLEHTTAINDFRIAVTVSAQIAGYEVSTWVSESALKANYDRVSIRTQPNKLQTVSLIPDSYFVLKTPFGLLNFFLEVDRGSETIGRFKSKILAYRMYHQSGAYKRRYQSNRMRILTVTTGVKRLENLKAATESVGGKHRFWFAHLDDITPDTILNQPVWYMAGEEQRRSLIE
ncbi:MAG: replication-relaxation family protein [Chloroflexi bacterium]|nr:replication-relaxation family protein [Chloroflexota bacterium]